MEGEDEEDEEDEKEEREEAYRFRDNPKLGGPSPTAMLRNGHRMENCIPLGRLYIGAIILVESLSWSTVLPLDFKCFSHF